MCDKDDKIACDVRREQAGSIFVLSEFTTSGVPTRGVRRSTVSNMGLTVLCIAALWHTPMPGSAIQR
jgi:hypothetical protein